MDPWAIAPSERTRHEEQFRSLNPAPNGMVTGAQARNFFLQSGLPPIVLAQIWGLADVNGDGQMDINEFSIACKMITMKLKGFEVPKTLPPAITMSMAQQPPTSLNIMGNMGGMMMPGQPGMMQGQMQGQMPGQMPGMQMGMGMGMPVTSMGMGMPVTGAMMPGAGGMGMPMGMQQPNMGMPVTSMAMGMPATSMGMGGMGMQQQMQGMAPMGGMAPGVMNAQGMMQQPQAMMANPAMAAPAVPMSVASAISSGPQSGASTPGGVITSTEWAVPQQTRARYGQQFQATDRSRTGFLAGVQARNLLLQSGLPQNILAQIWGLSDVDNDGKLSAEEFILAGHLCDLASKGEPLPQTLPPLWVPPSMRKGMAAPAGSVAGGGSVGGTAVASPDDPTKTFEDKRRENFNKGQAELERRRQSLIDQQKKEEEERKRKEKEEKEERERQKQEMERQRLAEWEKQRKAELSQHRQREQEKVLALKAKHEHVTKDLDKLREKVKSLTDGISETRSGVTDVKTFIDGMRSSRDTKMQDMTNLKNKLKDQNARLLTVTQEKAKLEAKVKQNQEKMENGDTAELTEYELKKNEKEKHVIELRERLQKLKEKEEEVKVQFDNEKLMMNEHREKLKQMIESCKALYDEFDSKRREIKAEKAKRIRELTDPDHAWGAENQELNESIHEPMVAATDTSGYIQYKAIYDFDSRNPDELPFKAGDIIMVHPGQPHEPGWLGGELNGKVGWFPEAYVERVTDQAPLHTIAEEAGDVIRARALFDWTSTQPDNEISFAKGDTIIVLNQNDETWWFGKVEKGDGFEGYFPSNHVTLDDAEVRGVTPVTAPEVTSISPQKPGSAVKAASAPAVVAKSGGIICVALYPYTSEEPGDLTFEAGETIEVIKKDGDWWTGLIGDRVGVFPFNYVQPVETEKDSYSGVSWGNSASHVTHQVGPSTEPEVIPEAQPVPAAAAAVAETVPDGAAVEAAPVDDGAVVGGGVAPSERQDDGTRTRSRSKSKKRKDEGDSKGAKKPELATVVAPYTATGKEQLTLQRGQMILVRKKTDTGWWQGEIQASKGKKRQVGWFPASYVKLMESGGEKSSAAPDSSDPTAQAAAEPAAAAAAGADDALKFRALFAYAGQHEDELSFQVGDIISLISKDEEAWWRGNLHGNVGVFPSNYVELVEQNSFQPQPALASSSPMTNSKRDHVIMELLTTEMNFLEALELVRDVFIQPLTDANLLDSSEMEIVFINWSELILCSNRLCKSLKIRKKMSLKDDISIGDILCENISQMNAYIRFCASQLNSAALLQKMVEQKPGFDEYLRKCQSHPRVQGMPLSYFLLKPVKRITDYPTFVEKILKNTPSSHPDWGQLNEALTRARSLCDQVNEGMRHKENSERLEWLQVHVDCRNVEMSLDEKLTFNSMTNLMGPRKFLHQGLLRKTKSGRELIVFLFNDFLLLTLPNKTIGMGQQFSFEKHNDMWLKMYRKPIFLNQLTVVASSPSMTDGFSATSSGRRSSSSTSSAITSRKPSTPILGFVDSGDSNNNDNTFTLDIAGQGNLVLEGLSIHDRTLWTQKLTEAIVKYKEKEKLQKVAKESAIREEMNASTGRVLVVVDKATDLLSPSKAEAKIDAYCEVSMGSQEHKTSVVRGSFSPRWNASMQFFIRSIEEDVICFTVFDKDYFSPNEFLGRTELRLSEVAAEKSGSFNGGGPIIKTLPLHETESGSITVRLDLQLFS